MEMLIVNKDYVDEDLSNGYHPTTSIDGALLRQCAEEAFKFYLTAQDQLKKWPSVRVMEEESVLAIEMLDEEQLAEPPAFDPDRQKHVRQELRGVHVALKNLCKELHFSSFYLLMTLENSYKVWNFINEVSDEDNDEGVVYEDEEDDEDKKRGKAVKTKTNYNDDWDIRLLATEIAEYGGLTCPYLGYNLPDPYPVDFEEDDGKQAMNYIASLLKNESWLQAHAQAQRDCCRLLMEVVDGLDAWHRDISAGWPVEFSKPLKE